MKSDTINIRKLKKQDIPDAMRLVYAEGWNQTENDWQILVGGARNVCFAAETECKLVGTATAMNYNNVTAWIGMVLVDREYRGRGISKILLSALLDKLDSCKSVKLDATPAGQKVYEKLGFNNEFMIQRMVRNPGALETKIPVGAVTPVLPVKDRLKETVLFDELVFGTKRGILLRTLADRYPELAGVIVEGRKISGYSLGRIGSRYVQIGPVSAGSAEDAKRLVLQGLKMKCQQPVVVDVMDSKKELISWLESLGFAIQRPFTRMFLGENLFPGLAEKQFLICGPEYG